MADRSIPQDSSTAKTGCLGTGGAIQISECLAALLPFLPSGDPDTRATPARAPDRESVRISLPALRNVDRLQDRQPIGDCARCRASTTIEMIRVLPLITHGTECSDEKCSLRTCRSKRLVNSPCSPTVFMTVRREIAQSPSETGTRSREAGQHPAWEFRRGCAPFGGILQGGWPPPCRSGRGRIQSRACDGREASLNRMSTD